VYLESKGPLITRGRNSLFAIRENSRLKIFLESETSFKLLVLGLIAYYAGLNCFLVHSLRKENAELTTKSN